MRCGGCREETITVRTHDGYEAVVEVHHDGEYMLNGEGIAVPATDTEYLRFRLHECKWRSPFKRRVV